MVFSDGLNWQIVIIQN